MEQFIEIFTKDNNNIITKKLINKNVIFLLIENKNLNNTIVMSLNINPYDCYYIDKPFDKVLEIFNNNFILCKNNEQDILLNFDLISRFDYFPKLDNVFKVYMSSIKEYSQDIYFSTGIDLKSQQYIKNNFIDLKSGNGEIVYLNKKHIITLEEKYENKNFKLHIQLAQQKIIINNMSYLMFLEKLLNTQDEEYSKFGLNKINLH